MKKCPFCSQPETEVIAENELVIAFFDKFPVNTGHVLIIPKRHFADLFEATFEEMMALTDLLFEVKKSLQDRFKPDGYNVGVNVGVAATNDFPSSYPCYSSLPRGCRRPA